MRNLCITSSAALMAGICFMAEGGGGGGGVGPDRAAQVNDALARLDTEQDGDWTQGGLPDMERMKSLTALADLTRAEVSAASPGFTRDGERVKREPLNKALKRDGDQEDKKEEERKEEEEEPNRLPTAQEIAEAVPDPILLLEAATAATNASDRHRRNSALHTVIRGYMVAQQGIKDHQARLDSRQASREAEQAKAAAG